MFFVRLTDPREPATVLVSAPRRKEPTMIEMTSADRQPSEAYEKDLRVQLLHGIELMYTAKALGDNDACTVYREKTRTLYRELEEVVFALRRPSSAAL
jgi:hypothetical protein